MPRYAVTTNRTLSTTLSALSLTAHASTPRRTSVYELRFSAAGGTPADNGVVWEIQRCTTAGTGTTVTPQLVDPADVVAATATALGVLTADPTLTANAILFSLGVNQRAVGLLALPPEAPIIIPATASAGIAVRTPTAPATVGHVSAYFLE